MKFIRPDLHNHTTAWDRERLPDATSFSYRRPFNTIFSGNRRTDTGNDLSPIRRRRQSRLSNLRHSIAAPISNLLGHNASPERPAPVFLSNLLPRRRSATNSQVDSLFRPFIGTDTSPPEMARNIPSPVLETHGERLSIETQSSPDQSDTSSLTLTAVSDRQLGGLDNNPTLARILAIAASAISSQPEDNDSRITVANNQPPVGEVSINDSLRTIINSLQRRHANERNESGGGGERRGSSRNINFVRAFLVDNNNPNGPLNPARHIGGGRGNTSPPTANGQGYSGRFDDSSPPLPPPRFHDFFDSDDGGEEDSHMTGTTSPRRRSSIGSNRSQSPSRSITLVIVGVRAMRSTTNTPQRQSSGSEAGEVMRESSNPLSRLRASSGLSRNGNATGNGSSAATTTRESSGGRGFRLGRTRFSLRRRRLNTEITTRGNEAQAHGPRIPDSSISREAFSPIGVYDSPPGPAPPPTTPADPSLLSAPPSHSVTPRRLSTASNTLREVQGNGPVGNGNGGGGAGGGGGGGGGDGGDNSTQTTLGTPTVHIRQRRRSDSEAERHRGLGSGSSRRNGVVEPDDSGNPSAGRSWLIYVIGTNLSEVNPALLMPSLFTNSPTYEDMLMLSSLMGQVKTPVASESDVAGAQGLHTVVEVEGQLVAEMIHQDTEGNDEVKHSNGPQSRSGTSPPVRIPVQGERCLVCLSEYETGEEVRRLLNCKHIFHRQCIDQVSKQPLPYHSDNPQKGLPQPTEPEKVKKLTSLSSTSSG
ncbi:hypothetical protein KEM54_000599 [Ascosphaera aggregata]|nr:hypothetical protein KEM54_000599 [Ascosphaera aggregata]